MSKLEDVKCRLTHPNVLGKKNCHTLTYLWWYKYSMWRLWKIASGLSAFERKQTALVCCFNKALASILFCILFCMNTLQLSFTIFFARFFFFFFCLCGLFCDAQTVTNNFIIWTVESLSNVAMSFQTTHVSKWKISYSLSYYKQERH